MKILADIQIDTNSGARGTPEDFMEHFTRHWSDPMHWLDSFLAPLARDVILQAPTGTTRGWRAGYASLRGALQIVPDLRAEVFDWAVSERKIFIQMVFKGHIGSRPVRWHNVDVFTFDAQGVAVRRDAYFDPGPIRSLILRSPRALIAMIRDDRRAGKLNLPLDPSESEPHP